MKNKNSNFFIVVLLSGLLVSFTILVFNLVYQGELPKIVEEINNASIGAILTAVITVFLLGQQSKTEEVKDRNASVFEKKMELYNEFIQLLEEILSDNQLDASGKNKPDELKQLIFMLGKIRVVSSMQSVQEISKYLVELFKSDNQKVEPGLIVTKLNLIVNIFRKELFPDDKDTTKEEIGTLEENIMGLTNQNSIPLNVQGDQKTTWYLNSGKRDWDDMKDLGFWQAGGGQRYREIIQKLKVGDLVYLYISGKGYVGKGVVSGEATLLENLVVKGQKVFEKNRSVRTAAVAQENKNKNPDEAEYAIPIQWDKVLDQSKAVKKEGIFASPLTACRLNNLDTLQYLEKEFA